MTVIARALLQPRPLWLLLMVSGLIGVANASSMLP